MFNVLTALFTDYLCFGDKLNVMTESCDMLLLSGPTQTVHCQVNNKTTAKKHHERLHDSKGHPKMNRWTRTDLILDYKLLLIGPLTLILH